MIPESSVKTSALKNHYYRKNNQPYWPVTTSTCSLCEIPNTNRTCQNKLASCYNECIFPDSTKEIIDDHVSCITYK